MLHILNQYYKSTTLPPKWGTSHWKLLIHLWSKSLSSIPQLKLVLSVTRFGPWWFWTVVLEKTLGSPLDYKEIQPVHPKGEQSWVFIGGLMLKLKLQYFGHLMRRADSFEKTLMLGKIEGRRRRGRQRMTWLEGIINSMDMGLGRLRQLLMGREAWHAAVHEVTKSRTRLSGWTELSWQEVSSGCSYSTILETPSFLRILNKVICLGEFACVYHCS